MGFVKFGDGGFGLGGSPALVRGRASIVPPFLTGTLMDTLDVTVWPGSYPYVVNAYGRQMQVSDDGLTGWANVGPETPGTTFTLSGVNGKYIRVVETAFGIGRSESSNSAPVGPVVDLVELPALPIAAGAKVVGLGHSFIQRGGWGIISGGKPRDLSTSNVRAALPWIRLRDNRFNVDIWHDVGNNLGSDNYLTGAFQGYGGDHIVAEGNAPGVVARLPYVSSLRPGVVYLDIGTNDISSAPNVSVSLVVGRLDALLTLLRNEGIWTVIQTVTDRGAWPEGSKEALIVAGVNDWIKAQATRDGVRVCDLTALGFNHPAFDVNLFGGDVLHPNPKGGERMASALLPILQDMVSPGVHMDLTPATTHLSAVNLWADATFASSVASTATGTTGQRVSTMVLARQSGDSAAALSIEAEGDHNKQVITFSPSGNSTGNRYEEWRFRKSGSSITLASLGIVPGADWLEAGIFVELSPWDGWLSCQLQFEFYDAGNAQQYIARGGLSNPDRSTQDLPLATSGFSGWLTIPPFMIPGDVGAINWTAATRPLVIEINRRVAGTGTAKISKPFLRKCADPRPAWNLAA